MKACFLSCLAVSISSSVITLALPRMGFFRSNSTARNHKLTSNIKIVPHTVGVYTVAAVGDVVFVILKFFVFESGRLQVQLLSEAAPVVLAGALLADGFVQPRPGL